MTPAPHPVRSAARMRGAVLVVTLIVLVIMMLAAAATLRTLDNSILLSGNLAFKRDSVNHSAFAMNAAFAMFRRKETATDTKTMMQQYGDSNAGCGAGSCTSASKWIQMNYSPRLLAADNDGVPLILRDRTAFDAKFPAANRLTVAGQEMRFLIERMCNDFGPPNKDICTPVQLPPPGADVHQKYDYKDPPTITPLYRITVRIDGPRNTRTYAQAIATIQ